MNWSEEKRIRLVDISDVIETIVIISSNLFGNIFSYVDKEVIKRISHGCPQNPHGKHHLELSFVAPTLTDFFLEVCPAYAGPHDILYNTTKTVCVMVRPEQSQGRY